MNNEHEKDSKLLAELRLCEIGVWEALVRGDAQADDAALDDKFLGVYSDGFSGKIDHVQQLANGPTVAAYELSDLRVLPLGKDHAVLSYRALFLRRRHTAPEAMYVSSIWQRTKQGWINVFSQDTPAIV
jgi:hypothetical protein